MNTNYQEAWARKLKGQTAQLTLADVHRFLETLDTESLRAFIEDVLTEGFEHLQHIFAPLGDRHTRSEESAFDSLMDAPPELIRAKFTPIFDEIFSSALGGRYAPKERKSVLDGLKAITAKNKAGLSAKAIREAVQHSRNMEVPLRIELLMLLSKVEDPNENYSFWMDMRKKISENPHLGAAVIEAFKRKRPWAALEVLECYNDPSLANYEPKDYMIYFKTAVDAALYYYFVGAPTKEKVRQYRHLRGRLGAPWAKGLLDDLMARPSFEHVRDFMEKMDKEPPESSPVTAEEVYKVVLSQPANTDMIGTLADQIAMDMEEHLKLIEIVVGKHFKPSYEKAMLQMFYPFFRDWSKDVCNIVRLQCKVQMIRDDRILEDLESGPQERKEHPFVKISELQHIFENRLEAASAAMLSASLN